MQPVKLICNKKHAPSSSYGMCSALLYTWSSQIGIETYKYEIHFVNEFGTTVHDN